MRGSPTFKLFLLLCSLVVLTYATICLGVLNLILVSGHVSDRAGSLQSGCPLYLKNEPFKKIFKFFFFSNLKSPSHFGCQYLRVKEFFNYNVHNYCYIYVTEGQTSCVRILGSALSYFLSSTSDFRLMSSKDNLLEFLLFIVVKVSKSVKESYWVSFIHNKLYKFYHLPLFISYLTLWLW